MAQTIFRTKFPMETETEQSAIRELARFCELNNVLESSIEVSRFISIAQRCVVLTVSGYSYTKDNVVHFRLELPYE